MSIAEWGSPASGALPSASNGAVNNHASRCEDEIVAPSANRFAAEPSPTSTGSKSTGSNTRSLHRLATVRRQQGVSLRNMARRMNVDMSTVRQQEEETADLPLSVLYQWQKILEVPIAELLVDINSPLSPPVMERARMVKVMKTVAAIMEKANTPSLKRLLQMLCEQLREIMPELTDVAPWHSVGQRRTLDEYGRAVERQMPDSVFRRRA